MGTPDVVVVVNGGVVQVAYISVSTARFGGSTRPNYVIIDFDEAAEYPDGEAKAEAKLEELTKNMRLMYVADPENWPNYNGGDDA